MKVHWAHIDASGAIVTEGKCHARDVFKQELPEGLQAVARPDFVTRADGWRFVGNQWVRKKTEIDNAS